jgi:hypothetical protein
MGLTPHKKTGKWQACLGWAAVVAFFALVIAAAANSPVPPAKPVRRETPVTRCVDTGGIPVTSIWDGRLTNCIYPPQGHGR